MPETRRLTATDAAPWLDLRQRSLRDTPLAFWSSPEDDRASDLASVEAMLRGETGAVVFGTLEGDALVGTVGLFRESHLKRRHKMNLWGMYVAPEHRRRGIGAELVSAAIAHSRRIDGVRWLMLGVSAAAPEAKRLYERLGFSVWGTEPEAIAHGGDRPDEHHMALRL